MKDEVEICRILDRAYRDGCPEAHLCWMLRQLRKGESIEPPYPWEQSVLLNNGDKYAKMNKKLEERKGLRSEVDIGWGS